LFNSWVVHVFMKLPSINPCTLPLGSYRLGPLILGTVLIALVDRVTVDCFFFVTSYPNPAPPPSIAFSGSFGPVICVVDWLFPRQAFPPS